MVSREDAKYAKQKKIKGSPKGLVCLLGVLLMTISFRSQASETLLWYQQPADRWCEALPIGNGSQGGMIYGGTQTERIDFTDVTFFSGEPGDYLQEGAYKYLQPIRNALLARDYALAEKHIQHFIGMKGNYGTNLPLATLNLAFDHDSAVSDFRRSLDIDTALAQVRYRVADITYTREFLASHPARALVIHLSADKSKSLNFKLKPVGANESFQLKVAGKDLQLEGHAYEIRHSDGKTGVTGLVRFSVALSEGTQSVTDNVIAVSEATSATVYITMATNFGNRDARALCEERMQAVRSQSYEDIKGKHVADHQALFHRVQFSLDAEDKKTVPTDIRRKHLKQGGTDVGLVPLMYQYARYLTIASTRPDSPLPSHLQGVWNDNEACRIGWTCDMHLDINTQMNYWLTETTNLQECSAPLFKWIEETLVPSGKVTAKQLYRAKGWVAHIVSNPWGFTAPGWSNYWGLHPTGGAWIATHFWDHYQFCLLYTSPSPRD